MSRPAANQLFQIVNQDHADSLTLPPAAERFSFLGGSDWIYVFSRLSSDRQY
jgi:hypothetical protein